VTISTLVVSRENERIYGELSTIGGGNLSTTTVNKAVFDGKISLGVNFNQDLADLIVANDFIILGTDLAISIQPYGARSFGGRVKIMQSPIINIEYPDSSTRLRFIGAAGDEAEKTLFSKTWIDKEKGITYTSRLERGVDGYIYLRSIGTVDPLDLRGKTHNESQEFAAINKAAAKSLTSAGGTIHENLWELKGDKTMFREAVDELSGAFYTDLLSLSANNNDSEIVYEKITAPDSTDKSNKAWAEAGFGGLKYSANDNATHDFSANGVKLHAGTIISETQNSVNGAYASYAANNASQGLKKAQFSDIEFGLYKGVYLGNLTIKGNFAIGLQSFDVEREMTLAIADKTQSSFMTYGAKGGAEVQYSIWTTEQYQSLDDLVDVKLFGGLHAGFTKNGEIKESGETGLKIDPSYYLRVMGMFGVRADGNIKSALWYGKLFVGGIDFGSAPSYDMTMLDEEMNRIEGTKEQSIYAGLGGGFEYSLGKQTKLMFDASIKSGANMFEYYGGAGLKFTFGK
jgi:hypothetical protein